MDSAFAEPGPTHSRAAQSQFEMRSYRVVENDVNVHELWRIARGCGFADLRMMVFHGLPFPVSLDRFEDFLRGGETCAEWVADARVFLRNIRNFVLVKEGTERSDSRSSAGLMCEIDARLGEPAREGSPIAVRVIATNVGDAVWLPRTADIGGVSLGFHVFDSTSVRSSAPLSSNTWNPRETPPMSAVRGSQTASPTLVAITRTAIGDPSRAGSPSRASILAHESR